MVLVGSNLAWCHPVLHQRLMAAKAARPSMTIVVVDPRRTATAETADLHLALRPGSDVALFQGLLAFLAETGAVNRDFVLRHTHGFDDALADARAVGLSGAAAATGLSEEALAAFYSLVARTPRTVTAFSMGVNQAEDGTDRVNAILNLHLATGRIGKPGATPFSITGQPNAMGGREVGGLANQLAAHGEIDDVADRARLSAFWGTDRLASRPGLKAVDLFRAVEDGRIKALLIMGTNPAVSMPEADRVKAAIAACPFVVVADVTAETDTADVADVLLPALGWGEKDGTVTNSERLISRQRAFLSPPGEAMADWRILAEIGRRMGFPGFDHDGPAAIFREHAALSEALNAGRRDFRIGGLLDTPYEHLFAGAVAGPTGTAARHGPPVRDRPQLRAGRPLPLRDARRAARSAGVGRRPDPHDRPRARSLAHHDPHGKVGAPLGAHRRALLRDPPEGRRRTRHRARHPGGDRDARGLRSPSRAGDDAGAPRHRLRTHALDEPDRTPRPGRRRGRRRRRPRLRSAGAQERDRDRAPSPGRLVRLRRDAPAPRHAGRRLCGDRAEPRRLPSGTRRHDPLPDATAFALDLLAPDLLAPGGSDVEVHVVADEDARRRAVVVTRAGSVEGAFWMAPTPVAVSRGFAADRLGTPSTDLAALLAGRPGGAGADAGALVCSCFSVGAKTIEAAVADGTCRTLDDVATRLKAGGNCGSCRSEIRRILNGAAAPLTV